jgi:hypothetical protein
MFPRITNVRHVDAYQLEITFADDSVGSLDFSERILDRGGVFSPLEDVRFFSKVTVDNEAGTLVWPNGVDFDPDVLYSAVTGAPLPLPSAA